MSRENSKTRVGIGSDFSSGFVGDFESVPNLLPHTLFSLSSPPSPSRPFLPNLSRYKKNASARVLTFSEGWRILLQPSVPSLDPPSSSSRRSYLSPSSYVSTYIFFFPWRGLFPFFALLMMVRPQLSYESSPESLSDYISTRVPPLRFCGSFSESGIRPVARRILD